MSQRQTYTDTASVIGEERNVETQHGPAAVLPVECHGGEAGDAWSTPEAVEAMKAASRAGKISADDLGRPVIGVTVTIQEAHTDTDDDGRKIEFPRRVSIKAHAVGKPSGW